MLGKIKSILTIFLFLTSSIIGFGQYYSYGNDPSRAKWLQIKTDNYSLIYPRETDSLARIYLKYLETQRGPVYEPLGIMPKRIPIVLHPYTTISNGMVTWAPKRSELITTPDVYDGSADYWKKHLTLHEMRHIGQIEHYTKGIYNVFYYLIGEQVTGLGLGLFVSKYMLEGDAVISETELSRSGRGRNADFTRLLRAQYLNNDFKSYDRAYFGSYVNYTPDIYVLGYTLLSCARYQTGQYHLTGRMFEEPRKYWYDVRSLANPLRRCTGHSLQYYFRESQKAYSELWKQDLLKRGTFTEGHPLITEKKYLRPINQPDRNPVYKYQTRDNYYTEYRNGIHINAPGSKYDNYLLAVKSGMVNSSSLIGIDSTGKEHFLRHFNGISSKFAFDGKRRIYWSETISHNPATLEDFSNIRYLDIYSDKIESLTYKSKYFNPAVSPDGKTIAVAEYPVDGSIYLTFISTEDGSLISRNKTPKGGELKEIAYLNGIVYCTVVQEDGLSIMSFSNDKWERISEKQFQSISGLRNDREALYFSSDLDGVLNIYRYFPEKDSLIRITNSKYGADFPYMDTISNNLYYSEFDTRGYYCTENSLEELPAVEKSFAQPYIHLFAETLSQQVQDSCNSVCDNIDTFDEEKYPAKKYNKFFHAFRFHSWFPIYLDLDRAQSLTLENIPQVANLGVTLMSQNSLGTVVTTASYGYVEGFHKGLFKIDAKIWGNLSAEFKLDVNSRNQQIYKFDYENKQLLYSELKGRPLIQTNLLVYYPINFNSGGWYRTLNPQLNWSYTNDSYYSYIDFDYVNRNEIRYGISYGQILAHGISQIFPRWGFGFHIFGSSAPRGNENFGNLFYAHAYAYLPGITRTNGIKITASWQKQFAENKLYYLSSYVSMPRGYNSKDYRPEDRFFKVTFDYALPLYLGDIAVGPILYLKRLQLIPFFDFAMNLRKDKNRSYYSVGADAIVDFHFLRFSLPLSAGVRYARTGEKVGNPNSFQFLFNLNF